MSASPKQFATTTTKPFETVYLNELLAAAAKDFSLFPFSPAASRRCFAYKEPTISGLSLPP
jgi:hypothetical protein